MVSAILSRVVILLFGTLYPAYASYKAVKTKNVKEYVKWMMYWIVFALFCAVETFADVFLSWVPFYYEIKIIFVLWLLSPVTRGSSFIYRKFVHPNLAKREKEIDEAIAQARTKGYSTLMTLGHRGLTYATNVVVNTAIKGQGALVEQIRKSYSTNDLRVGGPKTRDDVDGMPYIDDSDEEFDLLAHDSATDILPSVTVPEVINQNPEPSDSQNTSSQNAGLQNASSQNATSQNEPITIPKVANVRPMSKPSQPAAVKAKAVHKKRTENRLAADNRELDHREKQDHEKLQRKHLVRSKSDATEQRPRKPRPRSGLSRVDEVVHESSMLDRQLADPDEEVQTYEEEIIYYSPRKSGHYTSKEVKADPYATLPRTRSRQRPKLNQF